MPFKQGHALVIGVGTHQFHPMIDVPITVADAEAVVSVLRDANACGYPPEQVQPLDQSRATKARILSALDDLTARSGAEDTVFLFYCGHGALGTDGNYYLVSHDARLEGDRVEAGTGVSEAELLQKLRDVKARRMLMIFNACHSGNISPSLDVRQAALATSNPGEDTAAALLGTGQGRIIIAACREQQVSYIGSGPLTIFTQSLVDGLRGVGVRNSSGFISAFSLYEHLYESVGEAAQAQAGKAQEPELTVLHGVGPFAVSLYRGARTLGAFAGDEPVPAGMAVREVSPKKSARRFEQRVNTGGGAYVGGNVNTGGGDFVGRDKITTTGPVATGGSAISTGKGAAVAGKRNVVVTGKVGGDVMVDRHEWSAQASPEGFQALLDEILRLLPEAGLDAETAEAVDADVKVVQRQAARPKPNIAIITSKLEGITRLLAAATGTAVAAEKLLPMARKAGEWALQLFH